MSLILRGRLETLLTESSGHAAPLAVTLFVLLYPLPLL